MANLHGSLVSISSTTSGDAFAVAASIGDQTLDLYDVSDFDELGGWVDIAGVQYQYDTVDMDADTIHLTTALSAATAVDDRVDVWDNDTGVVVTERVALVMVDGQVDGDPLSVDVDLALTPQLGQTTLAAGQSVTFTEDNDGYRVTAVHGKNSQVIHYSGPTNVQVGIDMGSGPPLVGPVMVLDGSTRTSTLVDHRIKTPDNTTFMEIFASAFTVPSDRRHKKGIKRARGLLAIVAGAPAYVWRYKTDAPDTWRVGPMANDMPAHTVQVDREDGSLTLDLTRQGGILWGAVGELFTANQKQDKTIAALTKRIEKLEKGAR